MEFAYSYTDMEVDTDMAVERYIREQKYADLFSTIDRFILLCSRLWANVISHKDTNKSTRENSIDC